jgi:hypothetical protein
MTNTSSDVDRRRFAAAVADAAGAVADILGEHQVRGNQPYPIGEVLPGLIEQHERLRDAVEMTPGPIIVDSATGKQDALAWDLGGLMSYLQLTRVVYRGLEVIPDWLKVTASRNISAMHLTARRVRDVARREAG